jgi:conjugal transfer pilus assembly protein TraD
MLRGLPRPVVERVQDYIAGLTPDQLSAIRGLGTRLAIISESHTGRYMSLESRDTAAAGASVIDLREALEGGDVVLFSLNSSTYGKLAAQLGTLVVQDLVTAVGHRLSEDAVGSGDGPRQQAFIGIDEFSALGADHVISLLARGREAFVSVLLATQELADLDRAAPGLRDQVLGNTAVKIIHRQDVPASAQLIAQMAGTETVWDYTRQIGNSWFGGYDTGRGTLREAERFIVHPNEIKSLGTGEAVVQTKLPEARVEKIRVSPGHGRQGPPRPDRPRGSRDPRPADRARGPHDPRGPAMER